jgi:hypothetical protein
MPLIGSSADSTQLTGRSVNLKSSQPSITIKRKNLKVNKNWKTKSKSRGQKKKSV